ncbi:hypothetical protein B0H13DRAFT_1867126 [Mycena leptocephala]|nr:hypothetical protein B0H13DRAFT_1867126 [Mycena leptocephala]
MATQDCLFSDKMQRPIVLMRKMFAPKPRPAVSQPTSSEPPTATEIQYNTTNYALNDMPMGENKDSDDDTCPLAPRFTSSSPHFPYPESRPQRESPYEKPPPKTPTPSSSTLRPSTSRPKPRSAYPGTQSSSRAAPTTGPEKALTGAEYLTNISTRCVVEKILKKFPHPVPERRLLWDSISKRPSNVATGTKSPSVSPRQKCRHAKEMAREMCGDDEDTQQQV